MPGTMKSTELARLARARLPRLAVLFTSGYTQNAIVHGGRLDEGVELLAKPYSSRRPGAQGAQAAGALTSGARLQGVFVRRGSALSGEHAS